MEVHRSIRPEPKQQLRNPETIRRRVASRSSLRLRDVLVTSTRCRHPAVRTKFGIDLLPAVNELVIRIANLRLRGRRRLKGQRRLRGQRHQEQTAPLDLTFASSITILTGKFVLLLFLHSKHTWLI